METLQRLAYTTVAVGVECVVLRDARVMAWAELAALARPSRRQVLGWTAMAAALAGCRATESPPPASPDAAPLAPPWPRNLPDDAREVVAAMAERILPSDAGPGAREARVIDFIDAQLGTPELAALRPLVLAGARLVDRWAHTEHHARFVALDGAGKDAVLDALAHGRISVEPALASFPQAGFFGLVHTLTVEGFLADPRHGGNADGVGWRAIGFGPHHHE
jgi:hypothetical protein